MCAYTHPHAHTHTACVLTHTHTHVHTTVPAELSSGTMVSKGLEYSPPPVWREAFTEAQPTLVTCRHAHSLESLKVIPGNRVLAPHSRIVDLFLYVPFFFSPG